MTTRTCVSRTWERLRPLVFCKSRVLAILVSQYFLSRGKKVRSHPNSASRSLQLDVFCRHSDHLAVEPVNVGWQRTARSA